MNRPAASDNTIRRLKADQEPLLPGLAYAGAAAIGGAVLVNRTRSMPVKILTPLAMATVTGLYFLPAHADAIKSTWTPSLVSRRAGDKEHISDTSSSMNDLKQSAHNVASDLKQSAHNVASDLSQTTSSMDDTSSQQQQQTDKEHGAKAWLGRKKAQAEDLLDSAAPTALPTTTNSSSSLKTPPPVNQSVPENPSSSRWSWWKRSAPKDDNDTKVQIHSAEPADTVSSPSTGDRVDRSPITSTTTTTITTTTTTDATDDEQEPSLQSLQQPSSTKPRNVLIDKTVASAAVKGHDDIIHRNSPIHKDTEETARKVHDNVVDAALPKHRQSRNEKHDVETSRQASQSDMRDGKFVVRASEDPEALPERVRRKSVQKDHHGLENLERRASMLFKGVENLEHGINKRMQKALQEEADFWHQESMKEQANDRGGERGL